MSVVIRKVTNKQQDSRKWKAQWETYPEGKRRATMIKPKDYVRYDLAETMTYEEARAIADHYNAKERKTRDEAKRQSILEKVAKMDKAIVLYLPHAFSEVFLKEKLASIRDERAKKRYQTLWRAVRKTVEELEMDTYDWARRRKEIFIFFSEKHWSPAYVKKIIFVMNQWGEFLSDKQGKIYRNIKSPKGGDRELISDAYYETLKASKDSEPLTVDDLAKAKQTMKPEQWKWIYVSLWFGLRPEEVSGLHRVTPDAGRMAHEIRFEGTQKIVWFYQWKKRTMPKPKRWKRVPVLFPEQEIAIGFIQENQLEEPLPKTLKGHLKKRLHLYGGRKGFQDLMTSHGREFFEIMDWLGHESIERTWRDYKNRQKALISRG